MSNNVPNGKGFPFLSNMLDALVYFNYCKANNNICEHSFTGYLVSTQDDVHSGKIYCGFFCYVVTWSQLQD